MSEPCKHGHVDGVMHKPCPQCTADLRFENEMLLCRQIDGLKERIAELKAERTALEDGLRELANTWESHGNGHHSLCVLQVRSLLRDEKESTPPPTTADDGTDAAGGVAPTCNHQWRNVTGQPWLKCINCGVIRDDT